MFSQQFQKRKKLPFEDEENKTFLSYLFASAMAMSPSSSLGFFLPLLLLLLLLFVSLFGGVGANATDSVYIYKAFSSRPRLNAWENHEYLNIYKTITFPFMPLT